MAYIAPIHRASSVRHALKLNFLFADEESVVLAKANRLEIYNTSCEGLSLAHTKTIYGKIIMLQKLHPPSSPTDHLFIGTDRSTYFTVSWDAKAKQLRTEKSYVDQGNKKGRDAYTNDKCLIDPTKRFMVLELFEGVLTVIPIAQKSKKKSDVEIGTLGEPISARIPELAIRSSAFLAPQNLSADREKPRIALLYRTNDERARLKLRSLEYAAGGTGEPGSAEFEAIDGLNDILSPGASHLIPVPAPARGVLIIAETSITYFNDHSKETLEEPLSKATIFSCWTQIDEQRYLLADIYGELYLLMLVLSEDGEVVGWNLDTLGKTSSASVLVYLDGGCVLIGSHQGDSQVIKIQEKAIEVVQTIPNIAPVLDFTIMDMGSRAGEAQTNEYSSGQARIVTGSGAFDDGSLRSVRSGVGLEELGSLGEMDHITELFSIRSAIGSVATNTLVVSFIDETRIFLFDAEGNVEEVEEHQGLLTSEGTLLASNLTNNRVLQVTKLSVTVSDLESGMLISGWSPPDEQTITAVSVSHDHLLLSAGGTEAFVLDISGNLQIIVQKTLGAENQIACVNVPSMFPDICIVGFWQSGVVKILDTKTLEVMKTAIVSKDAASIPRSVLLTQLLPDQLPTLFVALADGNVITFSVDPTTFQLSARKSIVLGTQQANFRELPRGNGLFNVFATCEHPSLIYGAEGRMIYSAVTAENASCICAFDSEAYPGAIAIATPEDLKIALVDPERTTHVQTLPIKQTVRRIAYSTRLKAFGMGTIDRRLVENVEIVQSHFKLVDEVIFSELDTYNLKEDELVESVIRADLNEGSGKLVERFVVGTAYISDKSPDTLRGRILVFEVTHDRKLKLVTELAVRGACRALGVVDGKIVAAMIKTVVIYAFEFGSLNKIASYRTTTAPISISVTGFLIGIADLMKSISIVRYIPPSGPGETPKLEEVARHFATAWSTAVANVDDDTYLESDAEGNLMVLRQNVNGVTEEDKRRLEVTSDILLGEMVNQIRSIRVPVSADAAVIPRAFLATTEGSIYLFALITSSKQDLLMRLQQNLATHIQSPGHYPFNKYRAFKNSVKEAEEPYRFVDGELIEKFLDCPSEIQEEIVKDLGIDVEECKGMVEALRRLT